MAALRSALSPGEGTATLLGHRPAEADSAWFPGPGGWSLPTVPTTFLKKGPRCMSHWRPQGRESTSPWLLPPPAVPFGKEPSPQDSGCPPGRCCEREGSGSTFLPVPKDLHDTSHQYVTHFQISFLEEALTTDLAGYPVTGCHSRMWPPRRPRLGRHARAVGASIQCLPGSNPQSPSNTQSRLAEPCSHSPRWGSVFPQAPMDA